MSLRQLIDNCALFNIFLIAFKGVLKDRVFQGILTASIIFLLIPSISTLSMRQATELSITLSLSLISLIFLLISVFIGGTSLWKDIERRYAFSVMGLPISRTMYVLGKFFGISGFVLLTSFFFTIMASGAVSLASTIYPPGRHIIWSNIFFAVLFDSLKYILLIACAFLFSSISTSFFLPIFGTISVFLAGSASQEVYDFIHTSSSQKLPFYVKKIAVGLYYVLPNFSAFDLKVNAIYSIGLSPSGILLTAGYFVIYTSIVLALSCLILSRRELM